MFLNNACSNKYSNQIKNYVPTQEYQQLKIHGWNVLVSPHLQPDSLKQETLKLLENQLYQITRTIPKDALSDLKNITIWAELNMKKTECMCYHISKDWLIPNDYNPDKEGAVEIGNAKKFLEWTKTQPWMVLHELAHGYHDKVLGFENLEINNAWNSIKTQGAYDLVLHINGSKKKHYALMNSHEYFAETTEAYFGCNDFYPFVRSELLEADPTGFYLMKKLWKDK